MNCAWFASDHIALQVLELERVSGLTSSNSVHASTAAGRSIYPRWPSSRSTRADPIYLLPLRTTMLHRMLQRRSIAPKRWLARSTRPAQICAPMQHRTFYSDLYENESHLFDLHRDEGRPTVASSSSASSSFHSRAQQSLRFSTSHTSAYEVDRQMHRVSTAADRVASKVKQSMVLPASD